MSDTTDDSSEESAAGDWPLYVRVLAVLHVLSIPIGFIGFIVLSLRAGWVGAHRQFGLEFWTVTLSAFGWMGLCARYRRWFENFGRQRWPDGKFK
jgi:hypothetical protein